MKKQQLRHSRLRFALVTGGNFRHRPQKPTATNLARAGAKGRSLRGRSGRKKRRARERRRAEIKNLAAAGCGISSGRRIVAKKTRTVKANAVYKITVDKIRPALDPFRECFKQRRRRKKGRARSNQATLEAGYRRIFSTHHIQKRVGVSEFRCARQFTLMLKRRTVGGRPIVNTSSVSRHVGLAEGGRVISAFQTQRGFRRPEQNKICFALRNSRSKTSASTRNPRLESRSDRHRNVDRFRPGGTSWP